MTKHHRRASISLQLARWTIFLAIMLGFVTSLIEITFDYSDERERIDQAANQALLVGQPSAANAVYQFDDLLAREVIEGLSNYKFIIDANIVEESGSALGTFERPIETGRLFWLTKRLGDPFPMYTKSLLDPNGLNEIGALSFRINVDLALSEFYDRLLVNIFLGIIKSTILGLILFAVFFYSVGRPLVSLSKDISTVDPRNPSPLTTEIGKGNRLNEIGWLLNSINRLLTSSQEILIENQEAQAKIQHNEVRTNDFARAASDWFWETDAEHSPSYLSERFFKITGYDPSTSLDALELREIQDLESIEPQHTLLRAIQVAHKPFRNLEFPFRSADGTTIQARLSGVPFFDADGVFEGYRGVGTDESELRDSEGERERLAMELSHAQKLRAIGQLTGGIAHDFNNLLAIIMGAIETVQMEQIADEEHSEAFSLALDAAKRGAVLTHRLLAYSRQQPLSPKSLEPRKVLGNLDDLLRRALGEKVDLQIVSNGGVWTCFADQQELETVIMNLAINARDAIPDGGKIMIEAFNIRLDEEYAMGGFEISPGRYVCFAISDDGIGMNKETIERAFDPYFTTKPIGKGSGLGLSMAFGFAKQSNGHIRIYSEEGVGTTIKLYLPKTSTSPNTEMDSAPSAPIVSRLEGLRILVVEDDPSVRRVMEIHLRKLGCITILASDPSDALKKCSANPGFDLFLLDVVLPGLMKSPDLAKKLHEIDPDVPVVFMSGYTENSIVHDGQIDDGVRLLTKPFSIGELHNALVRALEQTR
ncbi:MAG: ATP-binding protein [Pseudomonadota bacterium]